MKRLIGVVLFATFGFVGCGGNNPSSVSNSISNDTGAADVSQSSSDANVIATTLTGDSFSLQETLKDKPVVLWFWAPG